MKTWKFLIIGGFALGAFTAWMGQAPVALRAFLMGLGVSMFAAFFVRDHEEKFH